MLVKNIMQKNVISIQHNQSLSGAIDILKKHRIFTLPVIDNNNILVGLISKTQLLNALENKFSLDTSVSNIMITNVITVWPETTITTIGSLIRNKGIGRFPVVDKTGKLMGIVTKTDVLSTVAQETEKMLMEINIILNSADDGVIAVDLDGRIRLINAAAERMLAISKNSALGTTLNKLNKDFDIYEELLSTGKPHLTKRYTINNNIVIANCTPVVVEKDIVGAVSVLQDITKLESIAFELEKVKKIQGTLLTLVENPYEAAIVVNEVGNIELINKTFCQFLSIKSQDVIGKHIDQVIPNSKLMEVIETGQPQLAELWKIKGQEVVIMRVPILKDGKVIGAIGKSVFADLSLAKEFAKKIHQMEDQLAYFKKEWQKTQSSKYTLDDFIGPSKKVKQLKNKVKKAAQTSSTVLILGESGTGKELLAHSIHHLSPRSNRPFVKVNCAGIPEQLLESELFGYVEGAFTGAKKGGRLGKFQVANGGTIFLDEIGDMPITMQVKLLRVLQEKEVEPIGSNKAESIDIRVIAATNRNLEQLIKEGSFRLDLYYRLNVVTLHTPPLRERIEDIPELCSFLLKKLNSQLGSKIKGITEEALNILMSYHWPGNIRELQNLLERAINLADSDYLNQLSFDFLKNDFIKVKTNSCKNFFIKRTLEEAVAQAEKETIIDALNFTSNNKNQTAKILGIHRSKLYRKIDQYNIDL